MIEPTGRARRAAAVAVLLAIGACGDRETLLKDAPLTAFVWSHPDLNAPQISLSVDAGPPCPVFPNVRATQDGVKLLQSTQGGLQPMGYDAFGNPVDGCSAPTWLMAPVESASTTFVLSDDSATVTAELENAGDDGGITLVTPRVAVALQGERVEFDWTPATDVLHADQLEFDFDDGMRGPVTLASGAQVSLVGARIGFTFSNRFLLPSSDSGWLTAVVAGTHPVVRCEGVPACSAEFVARPRVPFTFVTP